MVITLPSVEIVTVPMLTTLGCRRVSGFVVVEGGKGPNPRDTHAIASVFTVQ
jgi:hypothetical protein